MAGRRLLFLAAARAEVREAFDWYHTRSRRAAAQFLAEIDRATLLIRESPNVWATFEAGTRRCILNRFPYSIIYREVGDDLHVVAVAHHKRRPGYWRSRLGG